jgi:hypothetical protein
MNSNGSHNQFLLFYPSILYFGPKGQREIVLNKNTFLFKTRTNGGALK